MEFTALARDYKAVNLGQVGIKFSCGLKFMVLSCHVLPVIGNRLSSPFFPTTQQSLLTQVQVSKSDNSIGYWPLTGQPKVTHVQQKPNCGRT